MITGVDVDEELDVVVVRTARETDYEEKLKKKVRTSGCAQGTVFGDVMESFESVRLDGRRGFAYQLDRRALESDRSPPSLYLEAGAIHGCVLCERDKPLIYMEDVGRHNAIDKIAGYMFRHGVSPRARASTRPAV